MCGSRNFCRGSRPVGQKTAWTRFFFFFSFLVQFTVGVQWFNYRENYTFPRIQRGANIFQWGGGGPNANSYRNPYNLWFSRGGPSLYPPPPHPPLDLHMFSMTHSLWYSLEMLSLMDQHIHEILVFMAFSSSHSLATFKQKLLGCTKIRCR